MLIIPDWDFSIKLELLIEGINLRERGRSGNGASERRRRRIGFVVLLIQSPFTDRVWMPKFSAIE